MSESHAALPNLPTAPYLKDLLRASLRSCFLQPPYLVEVVGIVRVATPKELPTH
jgi:hypothetical protein